MRENCRTRFTKRSWNVVNRSGFRFDWNYEFIDFAESDSRETVKLRYVPENQGSGNKAAADVAIYLQRLPVLMWNFLHIINNKVCPLNDKYKPIYSPRHCLVFQFFYNMLSMRYTAAANVSHKTTHVSVWTIRYATEGKYAVWTVDVNCKSAKITMSK
jgi:hypothetical protein